MPLIESRGTVDSGGGGWNDSSVLNSRKGTPAGNPPLGNHNHHQQSDKSGYKCDAIGNNGNITRDSATQTKLEFHCQQAQGSPKCLISGFSNVQELYHKIADSFQFPVDDILFCTLNTHHIDMEYLLSAQLCLSDMIFVHRKGTKKEVELTKTEEAMGFTVTDNGNGYAFIKRIKEGFLIDKCKVIQVGDHIEQIDDDNLVGWKHVEVGNYLKSIPVGKTITIRLVEPLKNDGVVTNNIGPKSGSKKGKSYGSGKETLRFRSNTPAQTPDDDDLVETAIESINRLLDNFMGINDVDLATQIFEMGESKSSVMELAEAVDSSELEYFEFTDDFLINVWEIVTNTKSRKLDC